MQSRLLEHEASPSVADSCVTVRSSPTGEKQYALWSRMVFMEVQAYGGESLEEIGEINGENMGQCECRIVAA